MVEIEVSLELATRDGPGGWKVVEVVGEIDLSTADRVEASFNELIEAGHHHLIADLTRVAFMDSTGLVMLVRVLRRTRDGGGDLAVVCTEGPVRRVLAVSGLDQEMSVRDTVASVGE